MACLVNTDTVYMHLCLQNAKSNNVITPFVLLIGKARLCFLDGSNGLGPSIILLPLRKNLFTTLI